jgi:hypothetical protein
MWWMKGLKLPDGYADGLRWSVNMMTWKLTGLKSHDYHIIMERLLPVMFWGYFDDVVWMVSMELSYFYRELCASNHGGDDEEVGEGDTSASMQDGEKKSSWVFLIQCNISLYIFHMKLKWVVLFNVGGCITLKELSNILNQWLAIGKG